MLGRLIRPLLLFALVGALVVPAAAGGHNPFRASGDFGFYGQFGAADCNGGGVLQGTAWDIGTASISSKRNRVRAVVSLRNMPANAPLRLRLVQGSADCHTVDATVETDATGNAFVVLHEESVSSTAFVAIDQVESGPVEIINAAYVTDTLNH